MKILLAIAPVIFIYGMSTEESYADVRCHTDPITKLVICEDKGHIKPWINSSTLNQPKPVVPIDSERRAPQHNYSECTIATGCIPK